VETRKRVAKGPPLSQASSVDFDAGGHLLAAKNTSGDILVMELPELNEVARFSGHEFGEGTEIHFASGGEIVHGTWSGLLVARDALTGAVMWQEQGNDIFELCRTRDRQTWAYRTWSKVEHRSHAVIRNWPFNKHEASVVPGVKRVAALALSDDACQLAIAADELAIYQRDSTIAEWSRAARNRHDIGGRSGTLSWSPDGRLLAANGLTHATVFARDLSHRFSEEVEYNCDVAFSPNGELLAVGAWGAGLTVALKDKLGS
jgi:WD40 repeat protein